MSYWPLLFCPGTIPPIKSARGEGDDVKKLFSIGSPVILVTLGVALLFIIRKKRKEKRLKRLRGERMTFVFSELLKVPVAKIILTAEFDLIKKLSSYRCQEPCRDAYQVMAIFFISMLLHTHL